MGRRRNESLFETLVYLPWPFGLAFGVVSFVAIKWGLAWYFGSVENPYTKGIAAAFGKGMLDPFAWLLFVLGSLAAAFSWFRARSRSRLLEE